MKKSKLNLIIDFLLLILMAAITGIGFIMKFRLISGHEKWEKYGVNLDTSLFGLDRHEWGTIHLILGFILIALLVIHIWLHWNMIICIFNKLIKNKGPRIVFTIVLCLLTLFFLIAPFVFNIEIEGIREKQGNYKSRLQEKNIDTNNKENALNKETDRSPKLKTINNNKKPKANSDIEIKGFMSISDVSTKFNIPDDKIKKHLGIPLSTPNSKRLGNLRKTYNFQMSKLREFVKKNPEKME
ncbi:MAG: DUF4405 domain-containing protein [Bacteroidales bacterium]|nr:DUF4405 domain-containing protein [Bacteroidales bacterium]